MTENEQKNQFWPTVNTLKDAVEASDQGYQAALAVALLTGVVTAISLAVKLNIPTISAWNYIDTLLFVIIAWRIKRRSRFFAIAGLCLYTLAIGLYFLQQGVSAIAVGIVPFLLLGFINGIRGTFAFYRLSHKATDEPKEHIA